MIYAPVIFAILLGVLFVSTQGKINSWYTQKDAKSIPLNLFPMIMSHDAASGEIIPERDHIITKYAVTQEGGLVDQLNCGARSFDYRPQVVTNPKNSSESVIFAHHGGIVVHVPMATSLKDIIQWSKANPSDLVVIYISHYEGDNCQTEVQALLDSFHIYTIKDCSVLKTLTYGQAMKNAQKSLVGQGNVLAIMDCTNEYYDPTVNCYSKDFVCYDSWPENTSQIPFNKMTQYLMDTTNHDPTLLSSEMWMTQAHWQSTATTGTLGTLHNSSLLKDETRSQINAYVEKLVKEKEFAYLNFLELDNVCDRGNAIYTAIQDIYLA